MKFDPSKVIESPETLPDGEYFCAKSLRELKLQVENNYHNKKFSENEDIQDEKNKLLVRLDELSISKTAYTKTKKIIANEMNLEWLENNNH